MIQSSPIIYNTTKRKKKQGVLKKVTIRSHFFKATERIPYYADNRHPSRDTADLFAVFASFEKNLANLQKILDKRSMLVYNSKVKRKSASNLPKSAAPSAARRQNYEKCIFVRRAGSRQEA
jgi:hypothetical protein